MRFRQGSGGMTAIVNRRKAYGSRHRCFEQSSYIESKGNGLQQYVAAENAVRQPPNVILGERHSGWPKSADERSFLMHEPVGSVQLEDPRIQSKGPRLLQKSEDRAEIPSRACGRAYTNLGRPGPWNAGTIIRAEFWTRAYVTAKKGTVTLDGLYTVLNPG